MVEPEHPIAAPSKWTSISSNDQLLPKLLEAYFLYDYPWFAAFHKDYFLVDMNNDSTRFCSSLLVNAILAAACVNALKIWTNNQYVGFCYSIAIREFPAGTNSRSRKVSAINSSLKQRDYGN
jgi:hypothetical protein